MKFKVGDIVRHITGGDLAPGLKNMVGEVSVVKDRTIGVIFPGWNRGHNLSLGSSDTSGWWVDEKDLIHEVQTEDDFNLFCLLQTITKEYL